MEVDSRIEKCTRSGRPRFISFSIPFIAAKCQELSSSMFEGFLSSFREWEIIEGWDCKSFGTSSNADSARIKKIISSFVIESDS